MQKKQTGLTVEAAETMAIQALAFLSGDSELMGRFMALSGLDPSSIRQMATEPTFLAAILEFLGSDDALILTFASNHGYNPEDVMIARMRLDPMAHGSTGTL